MLPHLTNDCDGWHVGYSTCLHYDNATRLTGSDPFCPVAPVNARTRADMSARSTKFYARDGVRLYLTVRALHISSCNGVDRYSRGQPAKYPPGSSGQGSAAQRVNCDAVRRVKLAASATHHSVRSAMGQPTIVHVDMLLIYH